MMERGTTVEIHWVPGHMGVEGNKKVGTVAEEAAEKRGTRRYPDRFASLAHVSRTITKRKWKKKTKY